MPRQKRRSLPGVLLLAALIASAVALGVYGNRLLPETGSAGPETGTETPTSPETQETTAPNIAVNETVVTPPTNTT